MAFYALATLPLIEACEVSTLSGEVWFADDATGCSPLTSLREWWDLLQEKSPHYGYYPNGAKTYLVVQPELVDAASAMFTGTNIKITSHGR